MLQLCAQAMCLEQMLACVIPEGFLFYAQTRRRLTVVLDSELREEVRRTFLEMHELFERHYTPKVKPSARCKLCSLYDLCMPKLCKSISVTGYIARRLEEED